MKGKRGNQTPGPRCWTPGRPFVELAGGRRFVLAPYQIELHRDGVWLIHFIDLPHPNGWMNLRVYRDENDDGRHVWSVGFTSKGRPARGTALKRLELDYPGMLAWLAELAKGNRPPAPKVNGAMVMQAKIDQIPVEMRRMIFRLLKAAWSVKKPLSLIKQAKGRYAPTFIERKFGVRADLAEALLQDWHRRHIVRNLCADKGKKIMGLKVSDVADETKL
jgi:hypothetical protein